MKVKSFSSSLPLPSMVFSTVRPPTLWVLVKLAAAVAPVAMLPEASPEVVVKPSCLASASVTVYTVPLGMPPMVMVWPSVSVKLPLPFTTVRSTPDVVSPASVMVVL